MQLFTAGVLLQGTTMKKVSDNRHQWSRANTRQPKPDSQERTTITKSDTQHLTTNTRQPIKTTHHRQIRPLNKKKTCQNGRVKTKMKKFINFDRNLWILSRYYCFSIKIYKITLLFLFSLNINIYIFPFNGQKSWSRQRQNDTVSLNCIMSNFLNKERVLKFWSKLPSRHTPSLK